MLRLTLPLVLVLVLAIVPAPAPAAPTPYTLSLAAGDNWTAVVFDGAVDCTSAKLYVSWQAGEPAAFALVYLFGGTGVFNYAAYWEEGNNVYVLADTAVGTTGFGQRATTPGSGYGTPTTGVDLSSALCFGTWTYSRLALVVPGASSARVDFVLADAPPAIAAAKGGADGFASFGRDFAPASLLGAKVDAGMYSPLGGHNPAANVATDVAVAHTLAPGMLGVFLAQKIEVAGLRVERGNTVLADADCVSFFISATCFSYGYVGGLGFGNATRAPAGDYEFRVRYQTGPEHHRLAAVGAPVDWCQPGVGPNCPNMGY